MAHEEVLEALKMRRNQSMAKHPLFSEFNSDPKDSVKDGGDLATHHQSLSNDEVSQPEGMAPMPQPHDQTQFHDPMKETGPGYETEHLPTMAQAGLKAAHDVEQGKGEDARNMKEAYAHALQSTAKEDTLRGKALKAAMEKK